MRENQTLTIEYTIQDQDLAKSLVLSEEDDFPEVFATLRMIALLELAAARLMKSILGESQLSVGVGLNVTHLAATPNHEVVQARAVFLGMKGKLYVFDVEVSDRGGVVGKGKHTRALIETERLVSSAYKRLENKT